MICFLILVLALPAGVEAAQRGRTTGEVNFRKGPDLSAPAIGRLLAGTEVEVINRNPAGWYFVRYQGRPGFVHESYIKLEKHQDHPTRLNFMRSRFVTMAGLVLIAIGVTSMLSIVAPFLFKLGIVLVGCALWVLMLDLAFNLGALYSLISVTLGLLIVLLFLARKKKNQTISTGENALAMKKAA